MLDQLTTWPKSTHRAKFLVVFVLASGLCAMVAGWLWRDSPDESLGLDQTVSLRLIGGVEPATAEWCVAQLATALDNPAETVWLSLAAAEEFDPEPSEPWIVLVRAEYRAPNRAGAIQRFRVTATFVEDGRRGDTQLTLASVKHSPPLPGVDFSRE